MQRMHEHQSQEAQVRGAVAGIRLPDLPFVYVYVHDARDVPALRPLHARVLLRRVYSGEQAIVHVCVMILRIQTHLLSARVSFSQTNYICPLCSKSLGDMELYFASIDELLEREQMPPEYQDYKSLIYCSDCERKSTANFHFVYHKASALQLFARE